MRLSVLIVLCLCYSAAQAQTKTVFVSSTAGNDAWTGYSKTATGSDGPVASFEKAHRIAKALAATGRFDTVFVDFAPGYYPLAKTAEFRPEDGGLTRTIVEYRGTDPDNKPVIGGARVISFTPQDNSKIVKIPVPEARNGAWPFEHLYLDGGTLPIAREPNEGVAHFASLREDTLAPPTQPGGATQMSVHHFSSNELDADGILQKLSKLTPDQQHHVLVTILYKWNVTKRYLNDVDLSSGMISTKGPGEGGIFKWGAGQQFYLENSLAFLDAENEWYLDRDAGVLYFYKGKRRGLATLNFYAPVLDTLLNFEGEGGKLVQNIIFRNLSFEYNDMRIPAAGAQGIQTSPFEDAAILADSARRIVFDQCEFKNLANNAIWLKNACFLDTVRQCYFYGLGISGIKIGYFGGSPEDQVTKLIVVDNNIFQHGGLSFPSAPGIVIYRAAENKITHNDISDFRYSGISNGYTWGIVPTTNRANYIGYNHIHHIGWGLMDDMGGIYSLGESFNTVIEHNLVHDVACHNFGANGIYLDNGSSGILVKDNVVYNCLSEAFLFSQGTQNHITNNIFAYNHLAELFGSFDITAGPPQMYFTNNVIAWNSGKLFTEDWQPDHFYADSNCYWMPNASPSTFFDGTSLAEWTAETGKDVHSITEDPGFINAENGDFRIGNMSMARRIGFVPFDIYDCGVYGSADWKKKALLPGSVLDGYTHSIELNTTVK